MKTLQRKLLNTETGYEERIDPTFEVQSVEEAMSLFDLEIILEGKYGWSIDHVLAHYATVGEVVRYTRYKLETTREIRRSGFFEGKRAFPQCY